MWIGRVQIPVHQPLLHVFLTSSATVRAKSESLLPVRALYALKRQAVHGGLRCWVMVMVNVMSQWLKQKVRILVEWLEKRG